MQVAVWHEVEVHCASAKVKSSLLVDGWTEEEEDQILAGITDIKSEYHMSVSCRK